MGNLRMKLKLYSQLTHILYTHEQKTNRSTENWTIIHIKAGSRYYKIQHLILVFFCSARTSIMENEIAQRNVNIEYTHATKLYALLISQCTAQCAINTRNVSKS